MQKHKKATNVDNSSDARFSETAMLIKNINIMH